MEVRCSHRLFDKYEHLIYKYARKVQIFDASYEMEDVEQEMRLKLYSGLISYGKRWLEYQRTQRYKPIPLIYYLKTVLGNKVIDFIKKQNSLPVTHTTVSIERDSFDFGKSVNFYTEVDFSQKVIVVNGVDLLGGMDDIEKSCLCMYLKGFPKHKVRKVFRNHFNNLDDVSEVIDNRLELLKNNEEVQELVYQGSGDTLYSYAIEDE